MKRLGLSEIHTLAEIQMSRLAAWQLKYANMMPSNYSSNEMPFMNRIEFEIGLSERFALYRNLRD